MAYAQSTPYAVEQTPRIVTQFDLTGLEPDQTLNLSHGGPTGAAPDEVRWEVVVSPTDGSPVLVEHLVSGDSTTADTVRLKVRTIPGGSLSGATVRIRVKFLACASNSIGTWTGLGGTTIP